MAPLRVERVTVPDLDTSQFASSPPAPSAEPRPRKPAKPREAFGKAPTYFTITTAKPTGGDCGRIEEAWYVKRGKEVALSDAAGIVTSEWRPIEGPGALWTARQALRSQVDAKRGPGPEHRPIMYSKIHY